MHLASREGHTTTTELLLRNGADPYAVDYCGRTVAYFVNYLANRPVSRYEKKLPPPCRKRRTTVT